MTERLLEQHSNAIYNIRCVATLFVIFYHCCCPYTIWSNWNGFSMNSTIHDFLYWLTLDCIYDSMMPSFFLISGMIYFGRKSHYKDRLNTFWKKVDRLIIPFAIISCLNILLGISNPTKGHLWFLIVLFLYFVVALLAFNLKGKWLLLIAIAMHLAYLLLIKTGELQAVAEIAWRSLRYFLYFVLGHYANMYLNVLRANKVLKVIIVTLTILTLFYNSKLYTQVLYSVLFNATLLCIISDKKITNSLWRSINTNSFSIYLLHHPIIILLFKSDFYIELYSENAVLAITSMFLIALLGSWLVSELIHRAGFKYF